MLGPKQECVLEYYANITGIIVMNSTIQKQSFQSAWKIILSPLLPLPIPVLSVVCRAWHGCPSKPRPISSSQQHPHQLQIHEVQSHCCASSQTFLCIWPKLCSWATGHRHELRKQAWASTTRDSRWQSPCCCFVHHDVATSVSAVRSERLQAPAGR